ncbi:hypothetical protein CR513_38664, partial [Mucuna pruriens]
MDHLGNWYEVLSLVKFTYNNSFHESINMELQRKALKFEVTDHIREDLTYEAQSTNIVDQRLKQLTGKDNSLVRAVWSKAT